MVRCPYCRSDKFIVDAFTRLKKTPRWVCKKCERTLPVKQAHRPNRMIKKEVLYFRKLRRKIPYPKNTPKKFKERNGHSIAEISRHFCIPQTTIHRIIDSTKHTGHMGRFTNPQCPSCQIPTKKGKLETDLYFCRKCNHITRVSS